MTKILFSPIGLTDPISNFRDGAMLNICRFCDIDKVYLYLSSEVYGYHLHDNRYLYSLEKLSELIGKKIDYELIVRENLVDVHLFDYFIDEFRTVLNEIHSKNPGCELYLNVSSGTPAMKSALQVLAAFGEIQMIPIQVSTPEKKSNPHAEEKLDYLPEQMWECNEDNTKPINRCSVSKNFNFILQIKKQMLTELINKYDYIGAKTLADSMQDFLSERFIKLLDAACMRIHLDYTNANNIFKKYGYKLIEHTSSDAAPLSEYLLLLDIKVKKGELADFIRAITPLLADLFELLLKDYCKFDINNFVYYDKKRIRKWDINKLATNAPDIKQRLDAEYRGNFNGTDIYSDHLFKIIEIKAPLSPLYNKCNELREIERTLRNIAAHEIVSVNSDWINNLANTTPEKIVKKIEAILNFTSIKTDKDYFSSYDRMNRTLISCMSE